MMKLNNLIMHLAKSLQDYRMDLRGRPEIGVTVPCCG
jgi:hypothetical protein